LTKAIYNCIFVYGIQVPGSGSVVTRNNRLNVVHNNRMKGRLVGKGPVSLPTVNGPNSK